MVSFYVYDEIETIYADIDPGVLYPADTAQVFIKRRLPGGILEDYPPEQTFEVGMLEGCVLGSIIVNDSLDTYFYDVTQPIKFIADTTGDSSGVVLLSIGLVDTSGSTKSNKISDAQTQYCFDGDPINEFVTASAEVKEEPTILLGETKYYQAKYDENSKLIIEELLTPVLNGGLENVWDNSSVSVVDTCNDCGKRWGVYWEKEKPMANGENLPNGLIRLVGRYLDEDSTYKVRLRAKNAEDSAYIHILVKKPKKLGNSYSTSIDVFGDTVYVDKLCIEWGGKLGVPPHFITGQMKSETSACSPFYPTYVFEPYTTQFNILKDYTYHNNQFFVQDDQTTFDPPVPSHSNVKDFSYYTSPTTVWQILEDHSELENLISGCGQRKYGSRRQTTHSSREDGTLDFYGVYSYPQSKYDEYKKNAYKKHDVENNSDKEAQANNEARDSLINHLKNEWDGGVKDGEKGLINIKAQTRMGASYGLLQMLYTTASKDFNYPASTVPEFLNELDGMLYSKKKLEKHLKDLIKKENSVNNWTLGLEGSFKIYMA